MASKTPKTLRLSDDIIRLIEEQPGENFTEKFELLVMTCVQKLPEAQDQLQRVQDQIKDEHKRLNRIIKYQQELERNTKNINLQLERSINQVAQGINFLKRLLDVEA